MIHLFDGRSNQRFKSTKTTSRKSSGRQGVLTVFVQYCAFLYGPMAGGESHLTYHKGNYCTVPRYSVTVHIFRASGIQYTLLNLVNMCSFLEENKDLKQ